LSNEKTLTVFKTKNETLSWFSLFGVIFSIFTISCSITSLLHTFFGWRLIPFFENSLDGFRDFLNYFLAKAFYDPLAWCLSRLIYCAMLVVSRVLAIEPYLPKISIPAWVRDFGLISLILLRAQTRAMAYSEPVSSLTLSETELLDWDAALVNAPAYLRVMVSVSWFLVLPAYYTKKASELPFRVIGFDWASRVVGLFVGGALMLGILYLVHDAFSVIATWRVNSHRAVLHRKFFTWTIVSILCAFIASLGFYVWNGLNL
jgi:hypothetical protein